MHWHCRSVLHLSLWLLRCSSLPQSVVCPTCHGLPKTQRQWSRRWCMSQHRCLRPRMCLSLLTSSKSTKEEALKETCVILALSVCHESWAKGERESMFFLFPFCKCVLSLVCVSNVPVPPCQILVCCLNGSKVPHRRVLEPDNWRGFAQAEWSLSTSESRNPRMIQPGTRTVLTNPSCDTWHVCNVHSTIWNYGCFVMVQTGGNCRLNVVKWWASHSSHVLPLS